MPELFNGQPEPSPPQNSLLKKVYLAMREKGIAKVVPTRFITSSREFDFCTTTLDEEEKVANDHSKRPFWLMEGAHPEHRLVLTKIRNTADIRNEGRNEITFYRQIAPDLMADLPTEINQKIGLPQYRADGQIDEQHTFVQTEFVEGEKVGDHSFEANRAPLTAEEYRNIVDFIKLFQAKLTPGYVQEHFAEIELNSEGGCPTYQRSREMLVEHEEQYRQWLGDELFDRASSIMEMGRELFEGAPWVFTNVDINVSNLIRNDSGKIEIIDWERLKLINNPAAAYSYIPAAHWKQPELQEEMLGYAIEANSEIPHFKDYLAFVMLFYRYLRVPMVHMWLPLQKGGLPEEKARHFEEALETFRGLAAEIINRSGIWSDDKNSQKVEIGGSNE